jgi:hypothetical protein
VGTLRRDLIKNSQFSRTETQNLLDEFVTISREVNPKADAPLNSALNEVVRLTNGKGLQTLRQVAYQGERPAATPDGLLFIGGKNDGRIRVGSILHEFGHHVEFSSPELARVSRQMVLDRATGPVASLKTVDPRYDVSEVFIPDKWVMPYVGKDYSATNPVNTPTEVISMGLEYFLDSSTMKTLYNEDRQHFMLILGILR